MRYEMMFPEEIRKAIAENWPAVLSVGVLEYHSEHCAVGVDALLVIRAVEILEKEMDLVILPAFLYGAATYAVEAPEGRGTVHVDSDAIHVLAREVLRGFLRVGFRNIHIFLHHQTENFAAGMPTDLALRLAARQAIFEHIERERGEGWWGDNSMRSYYADHDAGTDPFNWIQVHPFMGEDAQKKYPVDHAGEQETSLMLAFCPEGVDMKRISKEKWYVEKADKANLAYGNAAKKMILERMREILGKK
ncbi:MAG: creatininase family protein [Planctomycetota bacterium]